MNVFTLFGFLLVANLFVISAGAEPQVALNGIDTLDTIFSLQERPEQSFVGISSQNRPCEVVLRANSDAGYELFKDISVTIRSDVKNGASEYLSVISQQELQGSFKTDSISLDSKKLTIVANRESETVLGRRKQIRLTVMKDQNEKPTSVIIEYFVGRFLPTMSFRLCGELAQKN